MSFGARAADRARVTGTASESDAAAEKPISQMCVASQDIARRAYELFLDRGGEHGRDLEDWLQAETEIRGRVAQA